MATLKIEIPENALNCALTLVGGDVENFTTEQKSNLLNSNLEFSWKDLHKFETNENVKLAILRK